MTAVVAAESDLRGVPGCHIRILVGPLMVPTLAFAIQTQSTSKRRTLQTIGSFTHDHEGEGVHFYSMLHGETPCCIDSA